MNPAPMSRAVQPEVAAPTRSRRPSACPTRTAPAAATPSGTMNVRLDTLRTIWWASWLTLSSPPTSVVATAKTPTSSPSWSAAGQPSRISSTNRPGSNRGIDHEAPAPDRRSPRPQTQKVTTRTSIR